MKDKTACKDTAEFYLAVEIKKITVPQRRIGKRSRTMKSIKNNIYATFEPPKSDRFLGSPFSDHTLEDGENTAVLHFDVGKRIRDVFASRRGSFVS